MMDLEGSHVYCMFISISGEVMSADVHSTMMSANAHK